MRSKFLLLLLFWVPSLHAVDTNLARDGVEVYVSARTTEQIHAFYGARGMPPDALQELANACFLTVGLKNRRAETLWLEPSRWRLIDGNDKPIKRISRQEWKARWDALRVPLAAQSTFGWSQLPESRDLYPEETVGGNISLLPPDGRFTLIASFRTGSSGGGKMLELIIPNLSCSRLGENP